MRRDLQDLYDLPRSAFLSYWQKHAQPRTPRSRAEAARRSPYPKLAAFAPGRFWKWMTEYWRFRIGRRHPFQTYDGEDGDNGLYQLRGDSGEIRIALAGDWGTGTDEAAEVAALIEADRPHYSIHLGDVYYVGDPAEVGANFLGVPDPRHRYTPCKWPLGSEGAFALNGNHEMYARGFGYFGFILPKLGVRGSPHGQKASYFCLENDHWRIIALDTGYNSVGAPILEHFIEPDCALPAELIDWLRTVVKPRSDDPRGIVILSHHQYVSRFDHCYPKPAQQLAEFFSRPVLWLWGHEHRLAIYQEAAMAGGVAAFGRCIGHGGMPVDLPPKAPLHDFAVEFVDERVYPNDENLSVGFNGFARMALRDEKLTLDYVDVRGTRVFSETWTVDRGKPIRLTAHEADGEPPLFAPITRGRAPSKRQGLNRAMQDPIATTEQPWHAEETEAALERCRSSAKGLTSAEAAKRLESNGPNRLPAGKPRSLLARVFAQFNNLLIYVLLASASITVLLRHALDAVVIVSVVLINAAIGFIQEGRAEKALDAIRAMLTRETSVLRDGRRLTVPAESLAVGDVVLIEAGDRIPADLRLLRASSIRIEEAVLTGESAPADKWTDPISPDAALGDRASMAYSGTLVASGQGAGLVVATGASTELGRISAMVGGVESLTTPLLRQMDAFARRLTIVILALAVCVCIFALAARGYEIEHAFMAAVGVAVAAIPEGLPAVMTITLAIGVRRMAERNAIIRRLPAVETLGAVSTICSDKTGTLTLNQMTVGAVLTALAEFEATGAGYEPRGALLRDGVAIDPAAYPALGDIARAALLCNDASLRQAGTEWIVDGDPMEGALIAFAIKAGADPEALRRESPRLGEIPFDARHRFMATLNRLGAVSLVTVKGAPERVLELCAHERSATGDQPLDAPAWREKIDRLAARGQRVIAFAAKPAREGESLEWADVETGHLTLLGLVGLIDPPRPEAVRAIAECKAAGIDVKMITGDHASTAAAIARELGLGGRTVDALTGRAIDAMDDAALRRALPTTAVFARTSPEHKLRLVEALQADGAVVSMTGDGVNDAPALKRADVGVAMGRKGTEAAKEAAEMVLADDNFATIAAAVREGRIVYDNLVKVLGWTLPTNGGQAMAIVVAILLGIALPMTPAQILWVNMVTGVTLGLAFAFDPAEPGVMERPPRDPRAPILSALLVWRTALVSALFCVVVFAVFFWALKRGEELEHAQTFAVNAMVGLEIAYLFSVRLRHSAPFDFRAIRVTRALAIGVAAVVLLQILFTYLPPLQLLYDTRPIDWPDMGVAAAAAIGLILALELEKAIRIGLFGARRAYYL